MPWEEGSHPEGSHPNGPGPPWRIWFLLNHVRLEFPSLSHLETVGTH